MEKLSGLPWRHTDKSNFDEHMSNLTMFSLYCELHKLSAKKILPEASKILGHVFSRRIDTDPNEIKMCINVQSPRLNVKWKIFWIFAVIKYVLLKI